MKPEVHHGFCFLRRYRGAAAGFRLGGDGWQSMSLSQTQAAAARGDLQAAAALSTMTNRDGCMTGCTSRGHPKDRCVSACRPGLCHTGGEQPYCVSK